MTNSRHPIKPKKSVSGPLDIISSRKKSSHEEEVAISYWAPNDKPNYKEMYEKKEKKSFILSSRPPEAERKKYIERFYLCNKNNVVPKQEEDCSSENKTPNQGFASHHAEAEDEECIFRLET